MSASKSTPGKGESPSDEQAVEQIARERFLRQHIEEVADRLVGLSMRVREDELTPDQVRARVEEARAELAVTKELVGDE